MTNQGAQKEKNVIQRFPIVVYYLLLLRKHSSTIQALQILQFGQNICTEVKRPPCDPL